MLLLSISIPTQQGDIREMTHSPRLHIDQNFIPQCLRTYKFFMFIILTSTTRRVSHKLTALSYVPSVELPFCSTTQVE